MKEFVRECNVYIYIYVQYIHTRWVLNILCDYILYITSNLQYN